MKKWVIGIIVGIVVCAVALGVFAAIPFRGAVAGPECPEAAAGALDGNTSASTVSTSATLKAGDATAGLVQVGRFDNADAAQIVLSIDGKSATCAMVAGRIYAVGNTAVRVDKIHPTSPWQDVTGSVDAKVDFTVSHKGAGSTSNIQSLASPVVMTDAALARTNIRQGSIGDCWMLAGLGAVSGVAPAYLREQITSKGDGIYVVTIYDQHGWFWPWETPTYAPSNVEVNAQVFSQGVRNEVEEPSWASVYEYAAAMHRGGSTSDIEGGYGKDGLAMVTGKPAEFAFDPPLATIQQGLAQGRVYVAASNEDHTWWPFDGAPDASVVTGHEYMVDSVAMRDGQLQIHLLNPWGAGAAGTGKAQDLWLTQDQLNQSFDGIAGVAAP